MDTQAHSLTPEVTEALLAFVQKPVSAQVTMRQLTVLCLLHEACCDNERTVRTVANTMKVVKPVVTRAATKLSLLGLVKRRRDLKDRRTIFLDITDAGREFLKI